MDRRRQGPTRPQKKDTDPIRPEKKTIAPARDDAPSLGLRDNFEDLFETARPAFQQQRTFERAKRLALAMALCLGRRTVTGMLCASGQQFQDWSANYRLFEQERIDMRSFFRAVIQGTLETLPEGAPLVGAIDDTLIKKKGRKIAGTSYRRDPLGPPFATNFIWASRFLQFSLALPEKAGEPSAARMIPVDLAHCPSPKKPGKRGSKEQWDEWKKLSESSRISAEGVQRIRALRKQLDALGQQDRELVMTADATFTCRAVFKELPERVTLIGRVRKDARFYALPPEQQETHGRGRKRAYGDRLPTPEQMRRDDKIPWREAKAHAAKKTHAFRIKEIGPIRWQSAGAKRDLRLIIIAPLGYCLTKSGPKLYRQPAYLITTDLESPVEELLQAYCWRWEIEVNFRDEKTLMGMGEAQVWSRSSIQTLTPFVAGVYALLLLSQERVGGSSRVLAPPSWQSKMSTPRTSTSQLLRELRFEVWGAGLTNKTDFTTRPTTPIPHLKIESTIPHAIFYASK